jgi:hypothetical protein
LLLSLVLVNLLNAATALYFCSRAVKAEVVLKLNGRKPRRAGLYLNYHLRNALTLIQNAAFLTNDEQAIELCNEAVKRTVNVLVSSESGSADPSEALFDNRVTARWRDRRAAQHLPE